MSSPLRGARLPALLGLVVLAVYAQTLYPDLAGGDSGELTGAVFTGGVIHPPGYPLYELLGRVFIHLPHGSIAWRMNFLSACCDAAAAAMLCAAVSTWTGSRAGGVVAGALFAASPGVWRYAICAEVFALDNLCVALLLLCAAKYARGRDPRWLLAGPLVAGLGMSNHQTIVFTAAPLAVWVVWSERAVLLRPRPLAVLAGFLALGLLPYLYLPVAASRHAAITWGAADTWSGFWAHVLRREYGTFRLAPTGVAAAADGGKTLAAFGDDAREQLGWWGLPLAALGLAASIRRPRRGLAIAWVAAPALAVGVMAWRGNLPVTDLLHRGIVARFWQQPEMYLCAWCGAGVAWLAERLHVVRWTSGAAWGAASGVFAAALSIAPMAARFSAMDRHGSTLVRSYGSEILRAAPPGALLVTKGDLITSPIRYLQAVEGARPDVRLVDQELLGLPWYGALVAEAHPELALPGPRFMPGAPDSFTMKQLLDANVDRAPVLICGGVKPPDTSADMTYGMWPMGLCDRARKGSEPVNLDAWVRESDDALPRIDFAGQPHPPGSWEDIVWSDTWEVRNTRAAHMLNVAGADPSRRRYVAMAADWLQDLVEENPGEPPRVYKTLAIAIGRAGLDTPESRARAADAWRHYLAVAPPDDPMVPAIRKELERLAP